MTFAEQIADAADRLRDEDAKWQLKAGANELAEPLANLLNWCANEQATGRQIPAALEVAQVVKAHVW